MEWTISTTQLVALVSLAIGSVHLTRRVIRDRIERKGYPLPPGPTPLPIVGSALSVSFEEPFRTYTEWQAKYGDLIYIKLLGMDVVVLNSISVATELLDKPVYSNRPFLATAKPFGHDLNFGFEQYSDYWKLCRRIFHQTFSMNATVNFHPMQLRKARQLVLSVMENPSDYSSHYFAFAAGVTMCSTYDYDPSPHNDEMVSIINNFTEASMPALTPERAVLFKTFPFLLHIPEWIPGFNFKRTAREAREWGSKMVETPYQYIRNRMEAKEDINPSMVSEHITLMMKLNDADRLAYEEALKNTASTAFLGAVESSTSLITSFTFAMVKNPHVCKRAQAEIDAIVGTDRLPDFDDRPCLPYVDAIFREIMRWEPPAPLGVAHATASSDIFNGFYIPKGATVFSNIWAMSRDETRYPDAEKFIPERFLDADGMLTDDRVEFVFGFGRRICPGRYSANSSLWIAIVTMLATLDFNLAKDAKGNDIIFEAEYINGIARRPLPFPCSLTPRPHITKATLERVVAK